MCTDKRATIEALDSIRGLTASDVKKKIKAEKAGEHKCVWIKYVKCEICDDTKRIYDDN